jgi:hypothetical protein
MIGSFFIIIIIVFYFSDKFLLFLNLFIGYNYNFKLKMNDTLNSLPLTVYTSEYSSVFKKDLVRIMPIIESSQNRELMS